jgi:hypothetical protein
MADFIGFSRGLKRVNVGMLLAWPKMMKGAALPDRALHRLILCALAHHEGCRLGQPIAYVGLARNKCAQVSRVIRDIPSVAVDGIVGPITWQALVSGMLSF